MKKIISFLQRNTGMVYGVLAVCVVCIFCIPYGIRLINQTPRYKWDVEHFGNVKIDEPFGAKYVDEYLCESWKGKIYHDSLDVALRKYKGKKVNYLIIGNHVDPGDDIYEDTKDVTFDLAREAFQGSNILIAGINGVIAQKIGINKFSDYPFFDIKKFLQSQESYYPIEVDMVNAKGKDDRFMIWNVMAEEYYIFNGQYDAVDYYRGIALGDYTRLIAMTENRDIAARRSIGDGCITLSYSFALFSNYAVGNEELRRAMIHLMNTTFDKRLPLVVVYCSEKAHEESQESKEANGSFFGEFLKQPCTTLFLWLLMLGLCLAIFVNGRRRQRATESKSKSRNSSIDYVRHLATIYTRRTNYADLLRIEKRMLLYKLRKEFFFDMSTRDYTTVEQFAEHVANTKQKPVERVRSVLATLEELTSDINKQVDDKAFRLCLKQLDEIFGK